MKRQERYWRLRSESMAGPPKPSPNSHQRRYSLGKRSGLDYFHEMGCGFAIFVNYQGYLVAIGAMKIELILRRSNFRDYYDIYSILREGVSLKQIVNLASKYSNHLLKTRDALSFLSNGSNFKKDKNFSLLEPVYDIDHKEIEEYIKGAILKEYA